MIALGPVQEKCDLVPFLYHIHELLEQAGFELSLLMYNWIGPDEISGLY